MRKGTIIKNKKGQKTDISYYLETLDESNRITNIISLREFAKRYANINPSKAKAILKDPFIQPHYCFRNAQYIIAKYGADFDYIEGVLLSDKDLRTTTAYHHAWIYCNPLECFVDLTLNPNGNAYYISHLVKGKDIYSILEEFEEEDRTITCQPSWINKSVPTLLEFNWELN